MSGMNADFALATAALAFLIDSSAEAISGLFAHAAWTYSSNGRLSGPIASIGCQIQLGIEREPQQVIQLCVQIASPEDRP